MLISPGDVLFGNAYIASLGISFMLNDMSYIWFGSNGCSACVWA